MAGDEDVDDVRRGSEVGEDLSWPTLENTRGKEIERWNIKGTVSTEDARMGWVGLCKTSNSGMVRALYV